jgi:hypothetical protein
MYSVDLYVIDTNYISLMYSFLLQCYTYKYISAESFVAVYACLKETWFSTVPFPAA